MTAKYSGGCAHVHVTSAAEPIDNHECHCNVCKSVTGQQHTLVAFFNHGDLKADHPEKMKRVAPHLEIGVGSVGFTHPTLATLHHRAA